MIGSVTGPSGASDGLGIERQVPLRRVRSWLSRRLPVVLVLGAVAYVVIVPMGFVLRRSFGETGFAFEGYLDVLRSPAVRQFLSNTLIVTVMSVFIATVLGGVTAYLVARTDVPGRRWLTYAPMLPVFVSPLIMAIGYVYLLDPGAGYANVALRGILGIGSDTGPIDVYSVWGVGLVMGFYSSAYVYPYARAGLVSLDGSFEEAARIAGAGRWRVLRTVTFPLVRPALAVGVLIALIISVAEFAIPSTIGSRAGVRVVSTEIFRYARGFPPQPVAAAALSVMVTLVSFLAFLPVYRTLKTSFRYEVVGARGHRSRVRLGRWRWPAFGVLASYVLIAGVAPIMGIALVSVSRFWQPNMTLDSFTLDHFRHVVADPNNWTAIRHSVQYALVGATVAVVLAFGIAYWRRYRQGRMARIADVLATIPLAVPGIAFGVGVLFLSLQGPIILYGTGISVLIAYVAKFIPLAQRALSGAVSQIKGELVEASRVAGAGELQTVRAIVGPLSAPAIFASWGLMTIVMLREFPASVLLTSSDNRVMSVQLFNLFQNLSGGPVGAYALIVLTVGIALLAAFGLLMAPVMGWMEPQARQQASAVRAGRRGGATRDRVGSGSGSAAGSVTGERA